MLRTEAFKPKKQEHPKVSSSFDVLIKKRVIVERSFGLKSVYKRRLLYRLYRFVSVVKHGMSQNDP